MRSLSGLSEPELERQSGCGLVGSMARGLSVGRADTFFLAKGPIWSRSSRDLIKLDQAATTAVELVCIRFSRQ